MIELTITNKNGTSHDKQLGSYNWFGLSISIDIWRELVTLLGDYYGTCAERQKE
jgi:hypothetical protein